MKRKTRIAACLVLSAVFIVSAVNVVRDLSEYRKGAEVYAEAEAIADVAGLAALADEQRPEIEKPGVRLPAGSEPSGDTTETTVGPSQPDPYESLLQEANLPALQEINSDVKGWIVLPGTGISYPLLQGGDNEFYLNHNWKKDVYSVGAIFLDSAASDSFTDFNTVIYGHRMHDRSMFGKLKNYTKQTYLDAHPDLYIRTADGVFRYRIYAAYEAAIDTVAYKRNISGEEARAEFIRLGLESSAVDAGIVPQTSDRFLTLVTCTGNGYDSRWIVQAVLTKAPDGDPAE